jgi:hypothetical protein
LEVVVEEFFDGGAGCPGEAFEAFGWGWLEWIGYGGTGLESVVALFDTEGVTEIESDSGFGKVVLGDQVDRNENGDGNDTPCPAAFGARRAGRRETAGGIWGVGVGGVHDQYWVFGRGGPGLDPPMDVRFR